jgi:uncharacterized membrane protein YeaQ/YmgE (transglycosylase-associated protein family)
MTLINFLILLLVAGICGAIGQAITGYSRGGFLVAIVVGFIGAYVGVWVAGQFGLPQFFTLTIGTKTFPVVWSILGAGLVVGILGMITSSRRPRTRTF